MLEHFSSTPGTSNQLLSVSVGLVCLVIVGCAQPFGSDVTLTSTEGTWLTRPAVVSIAALLCAVLCFGVSFGWDRFVAVLAQLHGFPQGMRKARHLGYRALLSARISRRFFCVQLLVRPLVAVLHRTCSAPRYMVRSWSSCPRWNSSVGRISSRQRQQMSVPAWCSGMNALRSDLCAWS